MKTVWASDFVPIFFGFVAYDEGYAAALEKMKAAGIDKVIAEYQTQLTEFLAGNK